jgi:hypothetical protein
MHGNADRCGVSVPASVSAPHSETTVYEARRMSFNSDLEARKLRSAEVVNETLRAGRSNQVA